MTDAGASFDSTEGIAEWLKRIPHFADVPRDDREALAAALMVATYPEGHVFIRQGEKQDTVFVVLEGEVVVTTGKEAPGSSGSSTRHASLRELNRMREGDFFGLLALVDEEPRSATCKAAGRCTVGALQKTAAALLFNQAAPIAYAFQKALGMQLARDFRNLDARLRLMLAEEA